MSTYFDPLAKSALWWLVYRQHLIDARRYPELDYTMRMGALRAYVQYLCHDALENVAQKEKSHE
jgi:hypothetical protein